LAETADIQGAADRAEAVLEKMAEIFTQEDKLLSSRGPVTIYYWLIRDCLKNPKVDLTKVRAFLIRFNSDLSQNKQRRSIGMGSDISMASDPELQEYEVRARSSNDAGSLAFRYTIIRRRLYRFLELETAEQQGPLVIAG
jgi:hypothetical protein